MWILYGKTYRKLALDAPVRTDKGMMAAEKVAVGSACEAWVNGAWVPAKMLGPLPAQKYTLTLTAIPGASAEAILAGLERAFKRELGTDGAAIIDASWEVVPAPAPATMPEKPRDR